MAIFEIHGKKIWVAGHNGMVGRAVVKIINARFFWLIAKT